MPDNGGPAFPQGYDYINDIPLVSPTGMSLRDYFAAHAPAEIPTWFYDGFVKKEYDGPAMPDPDAVENISDRDMCIEWMRDPVFDLPEHLRRFQNAVKAHRQAMDRHRSDEHARVYIAWRWAYADAMLAARELQP